MADRPISELFTVLADWVVASGQERVDELPGLWHGETADWRVRLNGHMDTREDLSPMTFELTHKTAFIGMAFVSPFGGIVVGPSEAELIDHFRGEASRLRENQTPGGIDQ